MVLGQGALAWGTIKLRFFKKIQMKRFKLGGETQVSEEHQCWQGKSTSNPQPCWRELEQYFMHFLEPFLWESWEDFKGPGWTGLG